MLPLNCRAMELILNGGVTVTLTMPVALPPWPSLIVYVNLSVAAVVPLVGV